MSASEVAVRGVVLGIDQASLAEAPTAASEGCPISAALKGNVAISVDPTLEELTGHAGSKTTRVKVAVVVPGLEYVWGNVASNDALSPMGTST